MTIRDYITKRARMFMVVGLASWLLFATSGMVAWLWPDSAPAITIIGFAGFAGAILGLIFFVRCPRCGAMLARQVQPISFFKQHANFCPSCGVSFDEQS